LSAAVFVSTGAAEAEKAPAIAVAPATTTAVARDFQERVFIAILLLSRVSLGNGPLKYATRCRRLIQIKE
jgi:hypothetical protein